MKFKVIIGVLVILASFSNQSQGLPFGDFELSSVAEYAEPSAELKRDKRTLTTICVEIKPSSPYEEPYFMCKGTDSPKYSNKGSSSESYGSKPSSYKPSKPSTYATSGESDSYHSAGGVKDSDYHAPSKPEYHAEHSKYNSKPASGYDSAKEYSAPSSKPSYDKHSSYDVHHSDPYSHYEAPAKPQSSYAPVKPSYADHHDSQDDYSHHPYPAHKVTYEKPSVPATYPSKPQTYSHDSQSAYDHRQPASSSGGYSKPSSYEGHSSSGGYSKPSSSYESPSEYSKPSSYDHSSSYDSNPSYNEESHSKPSYASGHDGHSYSAPPETKVLYSKPSSYPAKQISYEHGSDNSQYAQPKPSYSEQPSSSHHSQPAPIYGKPASYTPSEQHSSYAPPPQSHNYRMMPPELMQPTWEPQPQQLQADGFGYRSYGAPMEYQRQETPRMMNHESQLYTGLEGPLRFDLSGNDQEAPTLQSPYQHQTYSSPPAHHGPSYGQVAPSYTPHYAPASAPSYPVPAYPSPAPSYASVPPPPYVPVSSYAPAAPSYAPAAPSYASPSPAPTAAPCPQNYLYGYQPVIMSVPCYSLSASYGLPAYGQSLGAAPANVNPLQDHTSARSEGNLESSHKSTEDHSGSQESQESSDNKSDSKDETIKTTTTSKKLDNAKKPSSTDNASEENKQQSDKNSQEQVVGVAVEKPIKETQITASGAGAATLAQNPEATHTKEAFGAMMKMARIAAQLNKDDAANKGANNAGAGPAVQVNEKPPAGGLQQFSRTN